MILTLSMINRAKLQDDILSSLILHLNTYTPTHTHTHTHTHTYTNKNIELYMSIADNPNSLVMSQFPNSNVAKENRFFWLYVSKTLASCRSPTALKRPDRSKQCHCLQLIEFSHFFYFKHCNSSLMIIVLTH